MNTIQTSPSYAFSAARRPIVANHASGFRLARCHGMVALLVSLLLVCGCNSKTDFQPNSLAAASFLQSQDSGKVEALAADASRTIESLFGTPDDPSWPDGVEPIVDLAEVKRSAGPVGRLHDKIERGLYRKHCVQCHGVTGNGLGPAATLLAPYPRDFRRGTFKFKSTPIGSKPTKQDLVSVIEHGIAGTSMPAFAPLRNREEFKNDIEALVEYVVYLSVRGEVERRLLKHMSDSEDAADKMKAVELAKQVASQWSKAPSEAIQIPEIPTLEGEELQASILRGKELFASEKTGCQKCHGTEGKGDGISQDYDEWTKDWTIRAGIDPSNKSEWRSMKSFGALKPVLNRSRNFHYGALRGGHSLENIYKRVVLGIDGASMPAASLSETSPHSMNRNELFDLVRFVGSLTNVPMGSDRSDKESY